VESDQHEFHSLPLDDFYNAEQGKGDQTPPPSPAPPPRLIKERRTTPAENHRLREPQFQAHLALESNSDFRLISHWNQIPISGSFLDWNMLIGSQFMALWRVRILFARVCATFKRQLREPYWQDAGRRVG
jgi:hypothetical protein